MREIKKLVIIAVCLLSLSVGLVYVSNAGNVAYASSSGSGFNEEFDVFYADIMDRYNQGLITYEEAEDEYAILSTTGTSVYIENITSSTDNIEIMPMSSTKTVSGTVEWMPSSTATVPEPLRRVRIQLRNGLTSPTFDLIAESYTDYNGNYTFTYNPPLLGDYQNLSIVVFAESDTFRVARDWTSITPLLEYRVSALFDSDVNEGDRLNLIYAYENNNRHKAFYISQGLAMAQRYAIDVCGLSTDKILKVLYPLNLPFPDLTAFCWTTFMGVTPSYATIDTVMHEYGHFVQHCVGTYGINVPGSILDSGFDFNIFSHDSFADHLLHDQGKDFGMKLAWSEAWATAFAMMAQQQFLLELSWGDMDDRVTYTSYGPAIDDSGEGQEDAIISFLWDMFGTQNTNLPTDALTPLGNSEFWSTSTQSGTYTLTDFINILSSEYPQFRNEIGTRLSYFKIAPNRPSVSTFSQFVTPSFEWRVNGSQHNPNNQFRIAFYDTNGVQKYETGNVPFSLTPDASNTSRRDLDTASYTLTQAEWNSALSQFTSGATINILIKGYLSSSPVSGPYWSAYETINAPTILTTGIIPGTSNAEITGAIGNLTGIIQIPSAVIIDNVTYPVTAIGSSAFVNQSMNEIIIPSSVTSIGFEAFKDCTELASVNLSNTLESIHSSAFSGCSDIINLIIPEENILSIGSFAFYGCSGITSLTIPGNVGSIGESAFRDCTSIGNIVIQQGLSSLGDYAFQGCTSLTSVTIPQSVESIEANTFSSCPNLSSLTWYYNPDYSATDLNIRNYLTDVVFNSNITAIGDNAFWNCPNLNSVTIPTSVDTIGEYAFCLLSDLTQIIIPSSVAIIEAYAFSACSSLEIYSEASAKPSGWAYNWNAHYRPVYYYSAVSKVNCWRYVNNVPTIWYVEGTQGLEYTMVGGTFSVIGISTTNLTTLVIPSTYSGLPVTKVGNGSAALTNSYFLQTIVINDGILSIEANAFSGCSWLSSITIPNSVTSIGAYAFQNCTYLTTIPIPNNVTHIGASAFSCCTDLTALTIPQSVTSIGAGAFTNCSPSLSIVWNYNPALTAATFSSYYYTVVFPAGTTQISANAFANSPWLSIITIPNTITSVGTNAFANCASFLSITWNYNPSLTATNFSAYLTSVNFGSGLTSITANAFANCYKLSSISIPSTVTSIGNSAFSGCTLLQSISIPNGVTSIGSNAFSGCTGFLFFTIHSNVTSVGSNAFQNCNSNLQVSWNRSANSTLTAANFKTYLIQVYFASGTTTITAGTFSGCTKLTSISIPSTVTSIGSSAFSGCTGLTSITISTTVTSIGSSAFSGCTGFTKIFLPSTVTTMGSNVFQNCSNLTIYSNASSKPSGWQSTWNSSNRPFYWNITTTIPDVFSGFGYSGSTYYWTGAVRMTIGTPNVAYVNNGVYAFTGNTNLAFAVRTVSKRNAWSVINGSLTFRLRNSSGTLIQTHNSSVTVSRTGSVSISNGSFSVNTANLANGTYTLTLSSSFTRASWSGSSTHTLTFVVDK